MTNNFLSINRYLISILPTTLIFSIFLSDLLVSFTAIYFLFIIFSKKEYYVFKNLFFKIFALFYVIILISSFLSEYNLQTIFKSVPYIRFGIFVLLIRYMVQNDPKFLNFFLKSLTVSIFIILFGLIIQIFDFQYLNEIKPNLRYTSFFNDESIMGSYLIKILPVSIALLLFFKKKTISYFFILLVSAMILLSGERSALILLIIFLFFIFFLSKIYPVYIKFLIIFILFCSSIIGAKLFPEIKFRLYNQTLYQLGIIEPERDYVEFEVSKDEFVGVIKEEYFIPLKYYLMFQTSFKIFQDNLFFGKGIKSFRYECKKEEYYVIDNYLAFKDKPYDFYPGFTGVDGCSTHPHNYYLQLLSETGIFTFLIIILVFFSAIFKFFSENKNYTKIIYLSLIINLFPLIFTGSFYNNFLSILIFLPIGFINVKD